MQVPTHLSSRYTVSEEHQKAKQQFMEKERENARMEAKRRKLMEKRVRTYQIVHFHSFIHSIRGSLQQWQTDVCALKTLS